MRAPVEVNHDACVVAPPRARSEARSRPSLLGPHGEAVVGRSLRIDGAVPAVFELEVSALRPPRPPSGLITWAVAAALIVSGCRLVNPRDNDAAIVWSVGETNASYQQPYADDDLVVFSLMDRRVAAVRPSDGSRLWTSHLPGGTPGGIFGSLPDKGAILRWGELILVPGWDLFALDRATGAIRWTFAPAEGFPATSALALAGTEPVKEFETRGGSSLLSHRPGRSRGAWGD